MNIRLFIVAKISQPANFLFPFMMLDTSEKKKIIKMEVLLSKRITLNNLPPIFLVNWMDDLIKKSDNQKA